MPEKNLLSPQSISELVDLIRARIHERLGFTLQGFEYGQNQRAQMISTTAPELAIEMMLMQQRALSR